MISRTRTWPRPILKKSTVLLMLFSIAFGWFIAVFHAANVRRHAIANYFYEEHLDPNTLRAPVPSFNGIVEHRERNAFGSGTFDAWLTSIRPRSKMECTYLVEDADGDGQADSLALAVKRMKGMYYVNYSNSQRPHYQMFQFSSEDPGPLAVIYSYYDINMDGRIDTMVRKENGVASRFVLLEMAFVEIDNTLGGDWYVGFWVRDHESKIRHVKFDQRSGEWVYVESDNLKK